MRNLSVASLLGLLALSVACRDRATTTEAIDPTFGSSIDEVRFVVEDLGPGEARDLNAGGDVAGILTPSSGGPHPALWIGSTRTDLGLPAGAVEAEATGINDARTIVGAANAILGGSFGFVWRSGSFNTIPIPRATFVFPTDVNNAEEIVGMYVRAEGNRWHAFRYTDSGGFLDIHPVGSSYTDTFARAVSAAGVIAGDVVLANGEVHAARWTASNGFSDLGLLPGGYRSSAYGINSAGTIVGIASTPTISLAPFVWTPSRGMQSRPVEGQAFDISDAGRIVGQRRSPTNAAATGFGGGALVLLPTLPGTTESLATAVNRCGSVVGILNMAGVHHAARWVIASCDP